jgi:hypothetical protein
MPGVDAYEKFVLLCLALLCQTLLTLICSFSAPGYPAFHVATGVMSSSSPAMTEGGAWQELWSGLLCVWLQVMCAIVLCG